MLCVVAFERSQVEHVPKAVQNTPKPSLGRALGHFVFSLIGLNRILFTNIFQKL